SSNPAQHALGTAIGRLLNLALPELKRRPAKPLQAKTSSFIALDRRLELVPPESVVPLGGRRVANGAPMPKASVDKERQLVTRKCNVWPARNTRQIDTIPLEAGITERSPQSQLWARPAG